MKNLTEKQTVVLNFVKKYMAEHGYPPTIREICAGVNLSSTATVFVHIKNLEKNGYLKTANNKFRTIELLVDNEFEKKKDDTIKVPLLGKITAGSPITAIETPNEFFSLPASLVPSAKEVFSLHVSGESMINAGIKENGHIRLQPENDTMAPIILPNCTILGKAIGLYRKM